MEVTWEFILSHPLIMIMVFLPLSYIIFRDVLLFFMNKSELEKQRKELIEKERRVESLFRKVENNRAKLLEDIRDIDTSIEDVITDPSNKK
jgi:archaellum component FlaC